MPDSVAPAQASEAAPPSSRVAAWNLWMGSVTFVGISPTLISTHHLVVSESQFAV